MTNMVVFSAVLLLSACTTQQARSDLQRPLRAAAHSELAESLRAFEQQVQNAISRRDDAFLDRVTAATFVRISPDGKVEDRATVMALIREPRPSAAVVRRTIDPVTQHVQIHGEVGVVRGQLEIRGPRKASSVAYLNVYR